MQIHRPLATDVKPIQNYSLIITFENGEKRVFDVKPYFKFKQFEELKRIGMFNTVRVGGLSIECIHGQVSIYFENVLKKDKYKQKKTIKKKLPQGILSNV